MFSAEIISQPRGSFAIGGMLLNLAGSGTNAAKHPTTEMSIVPKLKNPGAVDWFSNFWSRIPSYSYDIQRAFAYVMQSLENLHGTCNRK